MTPTKRTILIVSIPVLFIGAFLAQKYIPGNKPPRVASQTETATTASSEVKAAEKGSPSSKASPYTEAASLNHLELTRSNVVWFTNYYRVKQGLKPLTEVGALDRSAAAKGSDMLKYQYFDHTRPGSTTSFDSFIDQQHYDFIKIGENIAMGDFSTSKGVVDAWIKSPPHKRNIMDSLYTEIGVSVVTGNYKGTSGQVFITQHFGDPRANCPIVNDDIKTRIDSLKKILASLKKNVTEKQASIGSEPVTTDPTYDNLVNEYNVLVKSYNELQGQIQSLVSSYNKQVQSFDRCISGKK